MFGRKKKKKRKEFHIPKKELEHLYYDLGWDQIQIGEHYGCSPTTVGQRMKEYNLEARHIGDYYRIEVPCTELHELYVVQEWTQTRVAAHYGCSLTTIRRKLNKCGIPIRPRPSLGRPPVTHVPVEVLANWPSPSLAYAVGLIAADGNLQKDNNVVRLVSTDRELIQHYRTCLQLGQTVKSRKHPPRQKGLKAYYVIGCSDRAYRTFLEELGLTPSKSRTLKPLAIPDIVFPDFARGCWDGDGGWHVRQSYNSLRALLASASPVFLKWMKECILRHTGIRGGISGTTLCYNGPKAVALGHWMYYAPDLPALTRKRAVWEQFT